MANYQESEELIAKIKSGELPAKKLNELLKAADRQLKRYARAEALLEKSAFTYNVYQTVLEIGGGQRGSLSASEWDRMLISDRANLRHIVMFSITEGQRIFLRLRQEIIKALGIEPLNPLDERSSWWEFWQSPKRLLRERPWIQIRSTDEIKEYSEKLIGYMKYFDKGDIRFGYDEHSIDSLDSKLDDLRKRGYARPSGELILWVGSFVGECARNHHACDWRPNSWELRYCKERETHVMESRPFYFAREKIALGKAGVLREFFGVSADCAKSQALFL